MSETRLVEFGLERFKSFEGPTQVPFAPLTVIIGRNNGGKSTLMQSLLLLKQTLGARHGAPLHLDGPLVSALSLRELTWGRPEAGPCVMGPTFEVRWRSVVAVERALEQAGRPVIEHLVKWTRLPGLVDWLSAPERAIEIRLRLSTAEANGETVLRSIELSAPGMADAPLWVFEQPGDGWCARWRGEDGSADRLDAEVDQFLPYLALDRGALGPRDRQRAWYNAWLLIFAQPIEALKRMLAELRFLGSTRLLPPSLYKPAGVAPKDLGVSGEQAAQLLHRRGNDVVHYLPLLSVTDEGVRVPEEVVERPLVDAVNEVLRDLSIRLPVSVEQIQDVGFRLLFGGASFQHVGRGLTYLLPLVELGLFADPIRFERVGRALTVDEYRERCGGVRAHIALEEPESHLHPKVQSRLAHWLVSLAMAGRSLAVETHSDHLVRRLRRLAAQAGAGSALESWLIENVLVVEVEQDAEGRSTTTHSRLTPGGGMGEHWPADFMDEATAEDDAIHFAGLTKQPPPSPRPLVLHDAGDEPEVER